MNPLAAVEAWSQAPELKGGCSPGTLVSISSSKHAAQSWGVGEALQISSWILAFVLSSLRILEVVLFPLKGSFNYHPLDYPSGLQSPKATPSASTALQPQQVSLPMKAISLSRFLPKQKLNAVCCLRSYFIIHTNRKLWKGASSEGTKRQDTQAKEKNRVPFPLLIFFLSKRVYFPFVVWCGIALGKQWQNLLCKSYPEFPLFCGSQLWAPPTSRSNRVVSGNERKDHGLLVQPVQ